MQNKLFFVTDVESTGPNFLKHSMYQFASVPILPDGVILDGVDFHVKLLSEKQGDHDEGTLQFLKESQGITLETLIDRKGQLSSYETMNEFEEYVHDCLKATRAKQAVFIADNLAYDWGFVNAYFWRELKRTPFGYAGRNIPDLSLGLLSSRDAWEQFRITPHTHDALDDVKGNAEALAYMIKHHGLKLK